jgi:UDP-glucose:(heptosyl)LPS alpha-1,3-glucosyltransferase
MRLAFALYEFTPHGGVQADCRALLEECVRRGHACRLFCNGWIGEPLASVGTLCAPSKGFSQAAKRQHFLSWVQEQLTETPADALIGFNPMPGLDIYLASGLSTSPNTQSWWRRRLPAYRQATEWQQAMFGTTAKTEVLFLADSQRDFLRDQFDLPDSRVYALPGGLSPNWAVPDKPRAIRKTTRDHLDVQEGEFVLLFVGSNFALKGLDRAIGALAQMRVDQPSIKARLLVIGQDDAREWRRQAKRAAVLEFVHFLGARESAVNLMLAADLLVHPVREDHSGTTVLEALSLGLPIVTTEACVTCEHVVAAKAGLVLSAPFDQALLNKAVMRHIDGIYRADCRESGQLYAERTQFGSRFEVAANRIEKVVTRQTEGHQH